MPPWRRSAPRGFLLVAALGLGMGLAPPLAAAAEVVPAFAAGQTPLEWRDESRDRPIAVRVWYPAAPAARKTRRAYGPVFRSDVATGAPYAAAGRRPLVVLSHGDRGSYNDQSWLAEPLAAQGYVVAAVAHYNNTWNRNEPAATLRLWERPLDLSFVITRLLADPVWGPRIDPRRIGAAGHSSGGYSVLALAGARFDPERMQRYCAGPARGPDCARVAGVRPDPADAPVARRSYHDPRVRAVVAMAPAVGPGVVPESLRDVSVPVLLVATADDPILLPEQHVRRYASALPDAGLLLLPQGGHFAFMPEVTFTGRIMTALFDGDVAGRSIPVDRGDLHREIVQRAEAFLARSLAAAPVARGEPTGDSAP